MSPNGSMQRLSKYSDPWLIHGYVPHLDMTWIQHEDQSRRPPRSTDKGQVQALLISQCPNNDELIPEDTQSDLEQEPRIPAAVELTNEETLGMSLLKKSWPVPTSSAESSPIHQFVPPVLQRSRENLNQPDVLSVTSPSEGLTILQRTYGTGTQDHAVDDIVASENGTINPHDRIYLYQDYEGQQMNEAANPCKLMNLVSSIYTGHVAGRIPIRAHKGDGSDNQFFLNSLLHEALVEQPSKFVDLRCSRAFINGPDTVSVMWHKDLISTRNTIRS
uniref:Uncharacterized protein n=1 Tax=Timema monikensis TaxID=170555 RepID=A0A7R9EGR3_9NEOP|nr:unnamed protein product [Timema monikensis]